MSPDGTYTYTVRVTAPTADHADQAMAERLDHEEELGFNYYIEWEAS